MDIIYIQMARGFVYLAAVLDWFSRRVLSWRVSTTMEAAFCVETLEDALARHGKPDIFNTDQGSGVTCSRRRHCTPCSSRTILSATTPMRSRIRQASALSSSKGVTRIIPRKVWSRTGARDPKNGLEARALTRKTDGTEIDRVNDSHRSSANRRNHCEDGVLALRC
ncbi:integrase-like protein [Bradyrhizobium sp. R2.2-H]|jgi:hypothetical protein|nr:integrase-like protein [Bradyrhizobium sp. Y-H1]TCU68992.1 integrase-like protein [Bradyrhizobium sp. R2.2-H]